MSDTASTSANALNVQQLFASLTSGSTSSSSQTDPNLFGQNLPSDPADTAKPAVSAGAGAPATGGLSEQAKSKRDTALAQARLNLLGLQEQSGAAKGAKAGKVAHHHHGGARPASQTSSAASSFDGSAATRPATGVTEEAANDHATSGLSTLLLAQLAAA